MTAAHSLNQEWQNWLDQNLERQCDPVELYQIMRDNGFSRTVIKVMMGDAFPASVEEKPKPKSAIDHETLANAPLGANRPDLVVERFDTDRLQLYTLENFMTPEECETLIRLAETELKPSEVTHSNGDDRFRTSETCDFVHIRETFVDQIEEKIARTMGIRLPYSEPIQVQRYDVGQEFKAHHDFFSPDMPGIYEQYTGEMGQRTWTFMVYLNSTPKGGGTRFTEIDQTFYPRQGMAVVWNNLHPDGVPNPFTMHHGMPVEEGKKVIITKWFRENGQGPMFYTESAPAQEQDTVKDRESSSPGKLTHTQQAKNRKQAQKLKKQKRKQARARRKR
ncbi:MAG: 2OG-Fe(II) oxygenase [Thiothrix sp.]|nr:2OG-Fe(II) oxygenase [Thiothrix sp.]HPQ94429.1 2OG-Fe(II) oxygenase [Thiolinea sp.]